MGNIKYLYLSTNDESFYSKPLAYLKTKWDDLETGHIYLIRMSCGSSYVALIQKYNSHMYGSVIIFSYEGSNPVFAKLINGVWSDDALTLNSDFEQLSSHFPVFDWRKYPNMPTALEAEYESFEYGKIVIANVALQYGQPCILVISCVNSDHYVFGFYSYFGDLGIKMFRKNEEGWIFK